MRHKYQIHMGLRLEAEKLRKQMDTTNCGLTWLTLLNEIKEIRRKAHDVQVSR